LIEVYADTSVLAKLYVSESNSSDAIALVGNYRPPLPIVALHEIELRNALRLKVFRQEMSDQQLKGALGDWQLDLSQGRMRRVATDWDEVMRRAEELSAKWTPKLGSRTLDILHVAAAVVLKCRVFLTFDNRQAELARKAGLRAG
jgi:predicted nucleic acid-binding protein